MTAASASGATRHFPNGKPLQLRALRFNTRQCGRLTNLEYDVIDMATRTGHRNVRALATFLGRSEDTLSRAIRKMFVAGILSGTPSEFEVTLAGQAAWAETDAFMVNPDSRPARPAKRRRRASARA